MFLSENYTQPTIPAISKTTHIFLTYMLPVDLHGVDVGGSCCLALVLEL